jgi:probable phosphoglycerate mutase
MARMATPLQLYLVRHGETAWALTGQHTGTTDLALTAHGEAQARELAARLSGIEFSHVFASPRLRARRTCELANLGATSQVEPDLAEWDYGAYEGRRSIDIRAERPDWSIWRDGCPGGESPADMAARVDRLIERLGSLQGNVALFSHGHLGAALGTRWIGLPLIEAQHFALRPASLSMLGHQHHPTRRTLELWNEVPAPAAGRLAP